jgi:hypothetical protein
MMGVSTDLTVTPVEQVERNNSGPTGPRRLISRTRPPQLRPTTRCLPVQDPKEDWATRRAMSCFYLPFEIVRTGGAPSLKVLK